MRKVYSAIIMTGIMAWALFPAALSASIFLQTHARASIQLLSSQVLAVLYTDGGATATLQDSDYSSDNTTLIQGLLNGAAITKIVIPAPTGHASWPVCPLFIKHNNTEIHLNTNAVIEAKSGGYPGLYDSVLTIDGTPARLSNIKVTGDAGSKIFMHKEEYTNGESRTAVRFYACDTVTVSGLTLANAGGDGVYVSGKTDRTSYSTNVTITNVVVDGAARNGLSVISVDGLTVTGCMFKNTQGTNTVAVNGPWAGIDLEPNSATQRLRNIVIDNCAFLNNRDCGLLLYGYTGWYASSTEILSMTVKNCIMQSNKYGIMISYLPGTLDDSSCMAFQDCTISDNKDVGVKITSKSKDAGTLSFTNCYLKNNYLVGATGLDAAFVINNWGGTTEVGGNVQLHNVVVEQPTCRSVSYFLRIDGTYGPTNYPIDNVSGTVYASGGTLLSYKASNVNVATASNAAGSHWNLDETSGNTAYASNGGLNGTLYNNPTWTIGRIGGGLTLNGTNQFVSITDNDSLDIGTGDFSISLWMQRSNDVSNKRLIYKGGSDTPDTGYALMGTASGVLRLILCSGGIYRTTECSIPNLDQWYHVAFTVDRVSGRARAYSNGICQAETDISAYNGADIANTKNLLIGAADSTGWLAWPGKADDVRIYKRVLDPGEVADFASGTSTHWRFDDGSGSTATDSIGRSPGTLVNSPSWVTGKLGGALTLNGANQYVSVSTNSSDLNIGAGDFSISLWMQRSSDVTGKRLLYKGASANDQIGYALMGPSSNALRLILCNGVTRLTTDCPIPNLNQWYHAVFTVDRTSGKATSYLNGVYQAHTDISAYNGADITNTKNLLIGAADSTGWLAWPGKVDDVRAYKRVLTANEARQLYSATP